MFIETFDPSRKGINSIIYAGWGPREAHYCLTVHVRPGASLCPLSTQRHNRLHDGWPLGRKSHRSTCISKDSFNQMKSTSRLKTSATELTLARPLDHSRRLLHGTCGVPENEEYTTLGLIQILSRTSVSSHVGEAHYQCAN
jgi:hypothetical protein